MNSQDEKYNDGSTAGLGRAVRRRQPTSKRLANHVPVRFTEAVIARVREFADIDGVTVSTWIRNVVSREVERRSPHPKTVQSDRDGEIVLAPSDDSAQTAWTWAEKEYTAAVKPASDLLPTG